MCSLLGKQSTFIESTPYQNGGANDGSSRKINGVCGPNQPQGREYGEDTRRPGGVSILTVYKRILANTRWIHLRRQDSAGVSIQSALNVVERICHGTTYVPRVTRMAGSNGPVNHFQQDYLHILYHILYLPLPRSPILTPMHIVSFVYK